MVSSAFWEHSFRPASFSTPLSPPGRRSRQQALAGKGAAEYTALSDHSEIVSGHAGLRVAF
jgi:hypothetical protein